MRMDVKHLEDKTIKAVVGIDRSIGWFGEVRRKGRIVEEYDLFTSGADNSLAGLLRLLVKHGFFKEMDVAEAHRALQYDTVEEIERPQERLAAEVIEKLKEAAAD